MTTEERLDFSIRLATMEFQRLRAGDWLNLREDLAGFLSAGAGQSEPLEAFGGVGVGPLEQPLPRDFPEKAFRALQRDLADVLEAFAYWDGSPREPETARVGQVKTKKLSTLRYAVLPIQDGAMLSVQGSVRDTFLARLFFLLAQQPRGKIRSCPECGTIFYRKGKQLYCSRACVNRVSARTFKQKHKAPLPLLPPP